MNNQEKIKRFCSINYGLGPEDFYYVIDAAGRRRFYSIITQSKVSKNNIPNDWISNIKIRVKNKDLSELQKERSILETQIKQLSLKLENVNLQLIELLDPEQEERRKQYENDRRLAFSLNKRESIERRINEWDIMPNQSLTPISQNSNSSENIPYKIIEAQKDENDQIQECTICLKNLDIYAAELPCTHVFHEPCIVGWIRNRQTCPICRLDLS